MNFFQPFTVTRVVNLQGPQTQVTQSDLTPVVIKKEPVEDPEFSSGMEERLQNIEKHLKLDKSRCCLCYNTSMYMLSNHKNFNHRYEYNVLIPYELDYENSELAI